MFNNKEKAEKEEKNVTFFRFEDLIIYHKSIDYINWLQDVIMLFPDNDPSQFVIRFMDSARNITFYIAEGSARNRPQFIHYLKLAKSSIRECLIFTTLALRQNNISELQEEESRQQLMEMTKMIGALISSLQRNGNGSSNHNGNGNYRSYSRETEKNNNNQNRYFNSEDHAYNDFDNENIDNYN